MNNRVIGLVLLLSSAIIYGAVLISASVYSRTLTGIEGRGWSTRRGIFGTALVEVGTVPLIIAVIIAIIGIIFIVKSNKKD